MVTSSPGQQCAMVQLYCSEQISIPESFPNILKTYAKAAIRTQPYDILRWSASYFRCLANNAPPPAKIRLERDCRQGSLTKGYLKVLVAQVGKGFFISRCLLQERWKALCLPEDELLKYLSLCRMLNWPQVHWLKVLAVMIGSLNETPIDTMVMVCELLTDDVDGGLARMPYWMFKICYTFVANLECSQEQCFVNGQKVLPWGDLEEATVMDSLPRVLSAALLRDTIIKSCKARFETPFFKDCPCPLESPSGTASTDFMINSQLEDPKLLLGKCEDFDTILLLLQDIEGNPLTEEDFRGPHFISEKQLNQARKLEDKSKEERQNQVEKIEQNARDFLQEEAFEILREVGPPWTWLHKFTATDYNTASYNFVEVKSIISDASPDGSSLDTFDLIKEEPIPINDEDTKSPRHPSLDDIPDMQSLESLHSILEEATKQNKCDLERTSSIISFLKSEELGVLQRAGEPLKPPLNMREIISTLERSEANGIIFTDLSSLMRHVKASLFGHLADFESILVQTSTEVREPVTPCNSDASGFANIGMDSPHIPQEWQETIPKQVAVPPSTRSKNAPAEVKEDKKPPPKEEITAIFESTIPTNPEQAAKMPKFCFDAKDSDELILGLVAMDQPEEKVQEEETGSALSDTDATLINDIEGYRQDVEDMLDPEEAPARNLVPPGNKDFYCCKDATKLEPKSYIPPPPQFHCSIKPMPGIGAAVSQKTIDEFLAYMRVRSHNQKGLVNPRNFKDPLCPYMTDTSEKK